MIISLPLSRFALSVSQFVLLGNWLLEADFKRKYRELKVNRAALVLISIYLVHVAGLIFTTDFDYAFKDLRIKLPLLALPVILATTKPLDGKKLDLLFLFYIIAVLIATFISFGILLFGQISDIREISPFISHIRLSLNICLAFFFWAYFILINCKHKFKVQLLLVLLALWMLVFLVISESATGIFVLLFTSFLLLVFWIRKLKNSTHRLALLALYLMIPIGVGVYLNGVVKNYLIPHKNDLKNLERYSIRGNLYFHDTINYPVENGSYTGLYVCDEELEQSWSERSNFDYRGVDEKGQELKQTLIRYLNSLGLRKDKDGMDQLTDEDINNIEAGIANFHYAQKFSVNSRMYKVLWGYQMAKMGGNPGGHSLFQRIEYWKASIRIIKEHFWLGVGTGDLDQVFQKQYEKMNTVLSKEYWHRSHNQYFAFFIAFGVLGFIWFIFSLFYPPLVLKKFADYHYFVFFVVICLSMLVEDTLETQMGVTLFAFFNSFLLLGYKSTQKI